MRSFCCPIIQKPPSKTISTCYHYLNLDNVLCESNTHTHAHTRDDVQTQSTTYKHPQ